MIEKVFCTLCNEYKAIPFGGDIEKYRMGYFKCPCQDDLTVTVRYNTETRREELWELSSLVIPTKRESFTECFWID